MLKNLRGFPDFCNLEGNRINFIFQTLSKIGEEFGFNFILTPVLEPQELFVRSLGESTDVVSKEMFSFQIDGSEKQTVCLRPEMTASVVKYCINNNDFRNKIMYFGQNFRKERPQKGRYRQFNQFGFEIIGIPSPFREIEIFSIIDKFFKTIGLAFNLKINSIGSIEERQNYIKILREYFEENFTNLSEESRTRLKKGAILRILDSKSEEDKEIISRAPKITEYLNSSSQEVFKTICNFLKKNNIHFTVEPTLVRGLDYYNDIVFEINCDSYEAAQDALGGGGAYDNLFEQFEAPKTNAFGMAFGVERIMLNSWSLKESKKKAYVAVVEPYFEVLSSIYQSKFFAVSDYFVSITKALEAANKNNINYLIIIGEETARGNIIIKNLEERTQKEISLKSFLAL